MRELDWFWNGFEEIADAPNGVARLRGLILSLAVQGRLVPQDEGDEPASVLLKRIKEEKARLVKAGKIRKGEPLAPIGEEQKHEIPASWSQVRLGEVATAITKGATPTTYGFAYQSSGIRFIKVENVKGGRIVVDNIKQFICEEAHASQMRSQLEAGDILFSIAGTIGETCIVYESDLPANTNQALAIVRGTDITFNPAFLKLQLDSFVANAIKAQARGGAMNNVSLENLRDLIVLVPPEAEQKRIVAKVDELMALCDELDARQKQKHAGRALALGATLHRLQQAADADEFALRLAILADHFEELLDAPESVAPLRAAILGLAVQGKLEPQDPNDEPASELLQHIAREKARLIAQKKIRKSDPLPPVDAENAPFELPLGWAWARFPELGEFGRGKSKHRPRNDPSLYKNGKYPLVQTGDVARANGSIKTYTNQYNEVGLTQSRLWPENTLCITIAANIADTGILSFEACFPDSVVGFVPAECLGHVRYFEYFLRTAKSRLEDFAPATAQKNINLEILQQVLVPLPPVAEIGRIVARVDDLMALCDELDARLKARHEGGAALVDAAVRRVGQG
jgi:type I restriction enzyme S subunit